MTLLREQVIFPGPEEEGGDGKAQERSWERRALSWHHGQGGEAAVSCAWRSECFWIIGPQISSMWALILSFCLLTGCSIASSYNSGCSNFLYFFLPVVLFGLAWLPTSCLFGFLFFLNKRLFSLSALGCRVVSKQDCTGSRSRRRILFGTLLENSLASSACIQLCELGLRAEMRAHGNVSGVTGTDRGRWIWLLVWCLKCKLWISAWKWQAVLLYQYNSDLVLQIPCYKNMIRRETINRAAIIDAT